MKYTNSQGITLGLEPWFSSGYRFTSIQMIETIGGDLAYGNIRMILDGTDNSLSLITDEYYGTLTLEKKESGNIYEFDIFITDRTFLKNYLTLNFVCIKDQKFMTESVSLEYSDIDSAINTLWPGKYDIRCETDISLDVKIFQNRETNHSLATKLAQSYKKKSVFSFGWDGFMIKEVIGKSFNGEQEPYWTILGDTGTQQIDPYRLIHDTTLYKQPLDPWVSNDEDSTDYSTVIPKNLSTIRSYQNYQIIGKDYYPMMDNFLYNQRFNDQLMYGTFRAVSLDIPSYRLGDTITYSKREQETTLPFKTYLIKSNELFMSVEGSEFVDEAGLHFSWTSRLIGLDEKDELIPEIDPSIREN